MSVFSFAQVKKAFIWVINKKYQIAEDFSKANEYSLLYYDHPLENLFNQQFPDIPDNTVNYSLNFSLEKYKVFFKDVALKVTNTAPESTVLANKISYDENGIKEVTFVGVTKSITYQLNKTARNMVFETLQNIFSDNVIVQYQFNTPQAPLPELNEGQRNSLVNRFHIIFPEHSLLPTLAKFKKQTLLTAISDAENIQGLMDAFEDQLKVLSVEQ